MPTSSTYHTFQRCQSRWFTGHAEQRRTGSICGGGLFSSGDWQIASSSGFLNSLSQKPFCNKYSHYKPLGSSFLPCQLPEVGNTSFLFFSTGDWMQSLVCAEQGLHRRTTPAFFLLFNLKTEFPKFPKLVLNSLCSSSRLR